MATSIERDRSGFEGPEQLYNPLLAPQTQTDKASHHLRLARRMLSEAAVSVRSKSSSNRRQWLAWVQQASTSPLGFRWCCDVAGVRPLWATKAFTAHLSDG